MKKIVFVLFLFILNIDTYGQSALEKFFGIEYHKGFVTLPNGDIIKGNIVFNNDYTDFSSVYIKDTISNEGTRYKPNDVLHFSIDSLYFYPKILRKKTVFMCLLLDDQLKVYLHKYLIATQYYTGTGTMYFLEKPNGQSVQILYNKVFNFKKHAGNFFKDYPQLSEKIKNKTYKVDDIFEVAHEYNEWLKQNQAQNIQ